MRKARCLVAIVVFVVTFFPSSFCWALTSQEVINSVISYDQNMTDYQASVSIQVSSSIVSNVSGGSLKWKRGTSTYKVRNVLGSPYSNRYICDGSNWNIIETDNSTSNIYNSVMSYDAGFSHMRQYTGMDMIFPEELFKTNTWDMDSTTSTINSVTCNRLYCTRSEWNYQVWVDAATSHRIMRIITEIAGDSSSDTVKWIIDFSNFTNVQNIAYVPASIDVKWYGNNSLFLETVYSITNIQLNQGLSDSVFALEQQP